MYIEVLNRIARRLLGKVFRRRGGGVCREFGVCVGVGGGFGC